MFHPRWRSLALVLVIGAVAAVPVVSYANHSWGNYHWARTSNPFTLKTHDNVTSIWEPYLAEAQGDWNQSTILDLNVLWQSPLSKARRCSSATGVIEVCNTTYGNNGWLGIAGISISGSHITKAYTKLNDTYFNTATYDTPAWRQMVTCQELAHDFGLDHQDETFNNANLGSCMDYTNDPDGGVGGASSNDPSNEHPNTHDYDQIKTIYNHLDSSTTVSAVFDAMAQSASRPQTIEEMMADAGQFGTPIAFDGQGRPNVFMMPIGVNGAGELQYNLTHVFWAPIDPFENEDRNSPNRDR